MKLFLDAQWQQYWCDKDPFAEARALQGTVYRSKEGRRTLRFEKEGRGYFLKLHEGVGWKEILKNLLQLRLPVLGAANEFHACRRLQALQIDTMTPVAFGERGGTISLEDYCKTWIAALPSVREKRAVIRKLAHISKTLHENGINHRDFYLCHFLRADNGLAFEESDALFLIDLHRVQMRNQVPLRWLVKDLSGLFYSAFDLPLTRRDILCFLSIYRREWLAGGRVPILQDIATKAVALYQKDFGCAPPPAISAILKHASYAAG